MKQQQIVTPGGQTLFDRLRAGDNHAWDIFSDTYRTLICSMGRKNGLKDEELGDLLSRVMLKFFNGKKVYEYCPEKNGLFRNYLWKVIVNSVRDIQRARARELPLEDDVEIPLPDPEGFGIELQLQAMNEALEELKLEMPPRAISAFLACKLHRQKAGAVAQLLNISLASVYNDCNLVWNELRKRAVVVARRNGYF